MMGQKRMDNDVDEEEQLMVGPLDGFDDVGDEQGSDRGEEGNEGYELYTLARLPYCLPDTSNATCEELLFLAQIAEKTEAYEDMKEFMKRLAGEKIVLSEEERNLLSMAYKNVVGKHRSCWRKVWDLLQQEIKSKEAEEDEKLPKEVRHLGELVGSSRSEVISSSLNSLTGIPIDEPSGSESEHASKSRFKEEMEKDTPLSIMSQIVRSDLEDVCFEFIDLLRIHLLPHAMEKNHVETTVFYQKLVGDYYRYLSEFTSDGSRKGTVQEAAEFYQNALELACKELPPADPLRLGLSLNASVFYFEIMNTPDKACELAKTSFDAAIASLDSAKEETHKEAMMLLELLRENLTIWTLSES